MHVHTNIKFPTFSYSGWSGLQNLVFFMCKALVIGLDISHIDMLLNCVTEFISVKFLSKYSFSPMLLAAINKSTIGNFLHVNHQAKVYIPI